MLVIYLSLKELRLIRRTAGSETHAIDDAKSTYMEVEAISDDRSLRATGSDRT